MLKKGGGNHLGNRNALALPSASCPPREGKGVLILRQRERRKSKIMPRKKKREPCNKRTARLQWRRKTVPGSGRGKKNRVTIR